MDPEENSRTVLFYCSLRNQGAGKMEISAGAGKDRNGGRVGGTEEGWKGGKEGGMERGKREGKGDRFLYISGHQNSRLNSDSQQLLELGEHLVKEQEWILASTWKEEIETKKKKSTLSE